MDSIGDETASRLGRFMERIYVLNPKMKKIVSIPPDDMLLLWRQFDAPKQTVETMQKAEARCGMVGKLSQALKCSRLHGTGMLVMITREAPLDEPLLLDALKPGDLANLLVFSKHDVAEEPQLELDQTSLSYGAPVHYEFRLPSDNSSLLVHSSRVLRFDGIKPIAHDEVSAPQHYWGISVLIPTIVSALGDHAGADDLRGSKIPTFATLFEDALELCELMRRNTRGTAVEQAAERVDSSYAFHYFDSRRFKDLEVDFLGLTEAIDDLPTRLSIPSITKRLVAFSDVPETRFRRIGPVVMKDSTSRDEWDYATQIANLQTRLLTAPLRRLDSVVARDADLSEAPDYMFKPLVHESELDQARRANALVDEVTAEVEASGIDRKEARRRLRTHPMFSDLPKD